MMPLSLFSPVGANFIKDWPAENTTNCNTIDTAAGPCLLAQPLTTYAPILKSTTTDPILGVGGIIRGFYYRVWDQIYSWGEFRFGSSGINIGSGPYIISLPVPADISLVGATSFPGGASTVGDGLLWDNSTDAGKRPLVCQLRDDSNIQFHHPTGDAGSELVNSGSPVTWTNSDGISWAIAYRRAT